jgi:hypothetical protein
MKSLELLSTKRRLKRIAPLQFGKLLALIYGILSIIIFIPLSLVMSRGGSPFPMVGPLPFGIGFVFVLPFIYAAVGFVLGVLGAAIYNVVAKWIGGIVVEVEWDREEG